MSTHDSSELLYAGIDAGGTKCKGILYTASGVVVTEALAGPANVFSDFNSAIHNIEFVLNELITSARLRGYEHLSKNRIMVCAACAGAETSIAQGNFAQYLEAQKSLELDQQYHFFTLISDLEAACLAANKGEECVLIIVGTGSVIGHFHGQRHGQLLPHSSVNRNTAKLIQYGGHGFRLGDDASGAFLGLHAIRLLLQTLDGILTDVFFTEQLLAAMGIANNRNAAKEVVAIWSSKQAKDYAELAPVVVKLFENGSELATSLIGQGADYLTHIIKANELHKGRSVFMTGGLSYVYQKLVSQQLNISICQPEYCAEYGAFLYLRLEDGSRRFR
ncbi:hypothetical protein ISG33_11445 [Glaciecola sp. MH2013]|uniref:BadF/BadG/BcrA/BcrD ATPase family protein n=1 Tax=Glaciecola sp. MH2013 TaxID=2785524 RepID=UPI00189D2F42|nr:BadF/BadG/BcrA/BcrD ATPase family protein [Glaciecola sp. MH2013]MBF7074014.1 hypothetical protein [Glaciecola sp. MH2013]